MSVEFIVKLGQLNGKNGTTITFRIDKSYEPILRALAKENKVSLNTLVNQIFGSYVEFETFLEKFGTVRMSSDTFRRVLNSMDEKSIIDVAIRGGSQEVKEFVLFKWKEINLQNVVEFIKMYFDFCKYGRCDLVQTEGKVVASIHHDFQQKGSLYLKHFLKSMIQTLLERQPKIITTSDTVTLEFRI
jgi:hypothetical protein